MTHNESLEINIKLKGDSKSKFLVIKEAKGLTNNTDVIRLMISEYSKTCDKEA